MVLYQTTKIRPLNIAFVLDAGSLKQLAAMLSEAARYLQFTITFADGTTVRYPVIEEVIEQPNPTNNAIVSLIAGTPTEEAQSCYVVFRGKPMPTVEYTINGPQERVVYLAHKLDQWIETIREGYSILYRPVVALAALALAFYSPVFLWDHVVSHFLANVPPTGSFARSSFFLGLWALWTLLATTLLPKATFAVGQGAHRHQTIKKIRAALSYTIPLTIGGSLIATWLHDHYR